MLPPPDGPVQAVVAFTAHHVIAAGVDEHEVSRRLPPGDLGAPMSPPFLLFLAGWLGAEPGALDAVLVLPPGPTHDPGDLVERDDLADHPRVRRAARYRTDVRVYADHGADGLLVVGRGLAGRWEMAFEVEPRARGRGLGRRLATAARAAVPDDEVVFAQVSPGNVASLRAVLAAGYVPIASEVLFASVGAPRHAPP